MPYGYGYPQPVPVDAFGRPLAGWWQRVGALVLDTLIVGVPGVILWWIVGAATSTTTTDPYTGTTTTNFGSAAGYVWFLVLVAEILYFAVLDGRTQSVGKRALGIAVRDQRSGGAIGFWPALARWVVYIVLWYVLFIPGLLNALSPLWDARRQAWHDHAVGSVVIRAR